MMWAAFSSSFEVNLRKFAHSPAWKNSPLLDSPHQKSIPPTKYQFSCYNSIKTLFLDVVIAPLPFLF